MGGVLLGGGGIDNLSSIMRIILYNIKNGQKKLCRTKVERNICLASQILKIIGQSENFVGEHLIKSTNKKTKSKAILLWLKVITVTQNNHRK